MARQAFKSFAKPAVQLSAMVELLKPITWFAPMWAFACGIISSGVAVSDRLVEVTLGLLLAGPLVCGTSQAVNDWFDRHVDAINEPHRPIPSGRLPGDLGLTIAMVWTVLSAVVAFSLGWWIFVAALAGLALAWAYSAPPFRLKLNGWYGNLAVAGCYEGLPWFTGAAIMVGALPDWRTILIALLYSVGAHGIMTLNDFKAVHGDRQMGVRSLPVQLGVKSAARLACIVMAAPQLVACMLLWSWGLTAHAAVVLALLIIQLFLMRRFLRQPKDLAPWYNATGTLLYVLGMLAAAFGLAQLSGTV
ncbi:MAG: chlorophyll synthase ChlG [Pseudomonadota bacterium]